VATLRRSEHLVHPSSPGTSSTATTITTTADAAIASTVDKALADGEFRATLAKMHAAAVDDAVDTSLETQLCSASFELLATTPASHKFVDVKQDDMSSKAPKVVRTRALGASTSVAQPAKFVRAVTKELIALRSALPDGVMVKAYEVSCALLSTLTFRIVWTSSRA